MTRMVDRCVLLGGLVVLLARALGAQTATEITAGIQFNFSNPGARSLALAGAFIGLADDATAAYTNPAGLTNLTKPEVSVEGRHFTFTNRFLDKGHLEGEPTNVGTDTLSGAVFGEKTDRITNLSFASFVYPRKGWAVAIYRHELANFRASQETEGAFFGGMPVGRFLPARGKLDLKIVNYGVALAFRIGEQFSVGAGASLFDFKEHSDYSRFVPEGNTFFGPPDYSPQSLLTVDEIDGDDRDFGFNVGALWKASQYLWVGGVYRQGPKFKVTQKITEFPPLTPSFESSSATFHVPDVYGVGLAARPTELLTITFDYDRVRFSQFGPIGFTAPDANQFHVGVQYVIPIGSSVFAIRGGYWRDPDHHLRVDVQASPEDDRRLLFMRGSDLNHYTGGIGLAVGRGEHFQLDGAFDYAETVTTISASAVVRF